MSLPNSDNETARMAGSMSTNNLETHLEMFIENMRQINIMVADFQPQAQTVLNQKVQKIVTDLKEIDKLKKDMVDVQIPMEVCEFIDEGQNPQLYTKRCMSTTVKKNEEIKGKIEAYKKFKAHLLVEMNNLFPNETERYRAIRMEEEEEEDEEEEDEEEEETEENGINKDDVNNK